MTPTTEIALQEKLNIEKLGKDTIKDELSEMLGNVTEIAKNKEDIKKEYQTTLEGLTKANLAAALLANFTATTDDKITWLPWLKINRGSSYTFLVQAALTKLGLGDNLGNDKIDANYGGSTTEAVKAFQKENSLSPDGRAGQQTLSAMYFKLLDKDIPQAVKDMYKFGNAGAYEMQSGDITPESPEATGGNGLVMDETDITKIKKINVSFRGNALLSLADLDILIDLDDETLKPLLTPVKALKINNQIFYFQDDSGTALDKANKLNAFKAIKDLVTAPTTSSDTSGEIDDNFPSDRYAAEIPPSSVAASTLKEYTYDTSDTLRGLKDVIAPLFNGLQTIQTYISQDFINNKLTGNANFQVELLDRKNVKKIAEVDPQYEERYSYGDLMICKKKDNTGWTIKPRSTSYLCSGINFPTQRPEISINDKDVSLDHMLNIAGFVNTIGMALNGETTGIDTPQNIDREDFTYHLSTEDNPFYVQSDETLYFSKAGKSDRKLTDIDTLKSTRPGITYGDLENIAKFLTKYVNYTFDNGQKQTP